MSLNLLTSTVELVFTRVAIGLPEDVLKPPDLNC